LPNPLRERPAVDARDDRVMSLWLADLGVNGLMAKEQRKVDRRDQRRREKQLRQEIDGLAQRREPRMEVMVSETAQAEARRRLTEALERAGMKD